MKPLISNKKNSQTGAAILQFVLAFPVLYLIASYVLHYGIWLSKYSVLTRIVHEAVMRGSFTDNLEPGNSGPGHNLIQQRVQNLVTAFSEVGSIYSLDIQHIGTNYDPASSVVRVDLSAKYHGVFGGVKDINISSNGPYLR